MVNARAMVARLQPSSLSMEEKKTPSTGPNIGAMPNAETVDAQTMAQP